MKEKAQARRDHLARMRAEQKRKERRAAFLMWGVGGAVIVLLVGVVGFYLVNDRATNSLDGVTSANYPAAQHVLTKVSYKENPPVGGEHHPSWQNCGVYDQPINNENAVHSLEHGAVWITYRPDLPTAEVDRLKKLASSDYMLLSPYPGLPAKIVASSWNRQLTFDKADDPRLPKFIAKYKNGPDTPELGASCDGAVGTTTAEAPIPTATPSASPSQSGSAAPETMPGSPAPSASPSGTPAP
ncbi:hypothetical protein FHS43_003258 [Streptosporangium becharense]|uniref:DUF3105 domain-containing protein n=1 Tax=Streptosporangium becharense TaxID=1816182 RepID=A0A7W9IDN1_9ACTN|nr:DUF3105 domain-containing protein [Streptosporangium becharense]MBB2911978.1 hypothetical protein [Streptosporangium becharense]MBB5818525.1 hypothetical protein [Streptosporangium becharense]